MIATATATATAAAAALALHSDPADPDATGGDTAGCEASDLPASASADSSVFMNVVSAGLHSTLALKDQLLGRPKIGGGSRLRPG